MKKLILLNLAVISIFISYNCRKSETKPNPGEVKLDLPRIPYEYHIVKSPIGDQVLRYEDNSIINNFKATIGRVLFYDKALSINNSIACASCHLQKNAFSDVSSLSTGFEEKLTIRNSMAISNLRDEINVGYFWDAREKQIENMVFAPIANHIEMGFERIDLIAEKISNLPYYKPLFVSCYGDDKITTYRMRESLAQFLFSIAGFNSKFDENLIRGVPQFTYQEYRGKDIFINNGCNSCHLISNSFPSSYGSSNTKFANIGLEINDLDPGINGEYKIPRLRNISKTAPYMHDGRFKTLEEVLEHYSKNIEDNPRLSSKLREFGKPRRFEFTEQEKSDLIAFLKTLDDNVVTTDVKFSTPFID